MTIAKKKDGLRLLIIVAAAFGCSSATLGGALSAIGYGTTPLISEAALRVA